MYTTFPVSLCASGVSRALLSLASVLERALVSLPTQLHSVLSRFCTKDLHFLLSGAMASSWQWVFIDLLKGHSYSAYFLSHVIYILNSLHTWFREVHYGAKMKVFVRRCHEAKKKNETFWGQKERYEKRFSRLICCFIRHSSRQKRRTKIYCSVDKKCKQPYKLTAVDYLGCLYPSKNPSNEAVLERKFTLCLKCS